MVTVKTKQGKIVKVTEFAAKEMVAKYGAVIIDKDSAIEPFELSPIKTDISELVNANKQLTKENAELKSKTEKLATDIMGLLDQIDKLKTKSKDELPSNKETKKGTKAIDPNS